MHTPEINQTTARLAGQTTDHYIIRGGVEGYDRLKVLCRVMHPVTTALFDRAGVGPGLACLDVGCGSGDVTCELGRRVGQGGRVVGVDVDEVKLDMARRDPALARLPWVELHRGDITALFGEAEFDVVYARFLLTHLADPVEMLVRLRRLLRPGGALLVEDIDFSGYFCYPDHFAHRRYVQLYTETAQHRGVDPNIGPRLPALLAELGLTHVESTIVQPMELAGEAKLIPPLTMKAIGPSAVDAGRASAVEVDQLVGELFAMAQNPATLMGMPRVVQAWGRAPA